jgi:hypothetical protein
MTRARDLSLLANSSILTTYGTNVGIGSTNPTSKLHVVGDANITGIITTTSINFAGGAVLGDTFNDGGFGLKSAPNQYVNLASNNLEQYIEFNDSQIVIGAGFTGDGNYKYWIFGKDGKLTFSDNTSQITAFTGYANTAGIATYATVAGIASYASSSGLSTSSTTAGYATTSGISTTSQGLTGTPNISVGIITATDYRIQSVAEKTTLVNGNTVSLVYNTGGGNVAICTNPSGDITLNVTGIPTDSTFDNYSLAFSVIVTNTGTARSCTAINLNGLSRTLKWFGGSLAAAISGVTTSNGYDVYSFTGINTVGSASTTANYIVLGSVNGSYR